MADLTDQEAVEAALLRPLTLTEQNYVPGLIAQASARLRSRLPTVDARIAQWVPDAAKQLSTAIDPDNVAGVLAEVIKRVLINPRGLWSSSEGVGPFQRSETYPAARGGGGVGQAAGLVITDADLAQLTAAGGGLPRTIFLTPLLPCR